MNLPAQLTLARVSMRRHLAHGAGAAQVTLIVAQLASGIGNLLVSLLAARLLSSDAYAQLVTFLAVYLAVHVPSAALAAAGAVDPRRAVAVRRRAIGVAATIGVALAGLSGPVGAAIGLPRGLVVLLAAALPGAAGLGLGRGAAYARQDVRAITASLVAEPLARCLVGVPAMMWLGAPGGAAAAVLGGYAALAACNLAPAGRPVASVSAVTVSSAGRRTALGVGLSFVAVAVLQVLDLVVANARLDGRAAAEFGALSTLGGAAVFATATVPLVLLPASVGRDPVARRTALQLALGTGLVIAALGWLAGAPLLRLAVGADLAGEARWLGPYLSAMAALGTVRVLIANRWTDGDGRYVLRTLAVAVAVHIVLLAALGTTVEGVVLCTLGVSAGLAAVLALPGPALRAPGLGAPALTAPRRWRRARSATWPAATAATAAMAGLCGLAAVVRLATRRGLWVDEAISVRQARLPFTEMLADVRVSDVHPPLHHALLWLDVRLLGTSELAARAPSLLAGVLLIPAIRWVGEVVYDRRTGWVAACLASIAPFCVWYSQEARMYSLFMLLATLAIGAQVQAIRLGRRVDWLVYGLATGALVWTQYFAVLPIAVQQSAFVAEAWRRRRQHDPTRQWAALVRGWLTSGAVIMAMTIPLLPILADQWVSYTGRSDGLVPGQAGAAASTAIGGSISIYAVGANLIWAVWGYHADHTMVQLAALWPLAMLLALVMLGRGRSPRSTLLAALVVVPLSALFAIGGQKRDLFELRYFSGAVPVLLLLSARVVTATTRRTRVLVVAAVCATATFAAGLLDQQLNGANPRLYDFEGALAEVHSGDPGGSAVVLYTPDYLGDVIDYYAPDLETRPLGSQVPAGATSVWVLASENVLDTEASAGRVGTLLAELETSRAVVDVSQRPNVRLWELR